MDTVPFGEQDADFSLTAFVLGGHGDVGLFARAQDPQGHGAADAVFEERLQFQLALGQPPVDPDDFVAAHQPGFVGRASAQDHVDLRRAAAFLDQPPSGSAQVVDGVLACRHRHRQFRPVAFDFDRLQLIGGQHDLIHRGLLIPRVLAADLEDLVAAPQAGGLRRRTGRHVGDRRERFGANDFIPPPDREHDRHDENREDDVERSPRHEHEEALPPRAHE